MDMKLALYFLLLFCLLFACREEEQTPNNGSLPVADTAVFTAYSQGPNLYEGFDAPRAINALASMENRYFRQYEEGISPWYGTEWRSGAEMDSTGGQSAWARFAEASLAAGERPDSMHCTIYAVRALEAGMGTAFIDLEAEHQKIYGSHEHAGWSIGNILVRKFGWEAYLLIDSNSREFRNVTTAFAKHKSYPVWRQPDIPLKALFVRGQNDSTFYELLRQNEFGWGFSHQGIHTWITRFDQLKECNWLGAPCREFAADPEFMQADLFKVTPFQDYYDYASHVVVFPPKIREDSLSENLRGQSACAEEQIQPDAVFPFSLADRIEVITFEPWENELGESKEGKKDRKREEFKGVYTSGSVKEKRELQAEEIPDLFEIMYQQVPADPSLPQAANACYNPRHALVFYKEGNEIASAEICLECQQYKSKTLKFPLCPTKWCAFADFFHSLGLTWWGNSVARATLKRKCALPL